MQITPEYAEAMKTVIGLLPQLGTTYEDQIRSLAALADYLAATSAPAAVRAAAPAPARPHYPEPADFQEQTVIGHIDGVPVEGLAWWNEDEGRIWRFDVRAELGGLIITTDGETLMIDATEPGCSDRWKVSAVGRLGELVQAGHLGRLITLGRSWCGPAAVPAQRFAA